MTTHQPLVNNRYSAEIVVNPDIFLLAGQLTAHNAVSYGGALQSGIKLALITKGVMGCQLTGQTNHRLEASTLCVIASGCDFTYQHHIYADDIVRYTIVDLNVGALAPFESELLPLFEMASTDPLLRTYKAPSSLTVIANQIATCPQAGMVREFYLQAKALEFTALTAELLMKDNKHNSSMQWRYGDIEKLHYAKQLLDQNLDSTMTLNQLANKVGLNTRKLNMGFRDIFDATVYGYLQETRLQEAHRLLSTGEYNVSTVAYRVGYTPAHFSVAFRKRFQIVPSELVGKRLL